MGEKEHLDKKVDAMEMEMEMLNPPGGDVPPSGFDAFDQKSLKRYQEYVKRRVESLIALGRLYFHMYPKIGMALGGLVGLLVVKLLFFRHRHQTLYIPPHLVNHFGNVEAYYDLKISKIDHWCLHGGDDDCSCEDPTVPLSREETRGWMDTVNANKKKAEDASSELDVVFLGDQFIQAFDGQFLAKKIVRGEEIQQSFNKMFHQDEGGLVEGITMGVAGDTTANLLWRMQNGEIPKTLNPKVWWLLVGANDLQFGQCSEEAVIVGILRLADEIAMKYQGAVVVIQGLLPRSSYSDGHLKSLSSRDEQGTEAIGGTAPKEFFKADQYPLWPAIQLINRDLETFCANHDKIVYYDAAEIFFGSLGNEHFKASQKVLIKELFKKDFATPSAKGFEILAKVISKEVVRIVYDDDETNSKASIKEQD